MAVKYLLQLQKSWRYKMGEILDFSGKSSLPGIYQQPPLSFYWWLYDSWWVESAREPKKGSICNRHPLELEAWAGDDTGNGCCVGQTMMFSSLSKDAWYRMGEWLGTVYSPPSCISLTWDLIVALKESNGIFFLLCVLRYVRFQNIFSAIDERGWDIYWAHNFSPWPCIPSHDPNFGDSVPPSLQPCEPRGATHATASPLLPGSSWPFIGLGLHLWLWILGEHSEMQISGPDFQISLARWGELENMYI